MLLIFHRTTSYAIAFVLSGQFIYLTFNVIKQIIANRIPIIIILFTIHRTTSYAIDIVLSGQFIYLTFNVIKQIIANRTPIIIILFTILLS